MTSHPDPSPDETLSHGRPETTTLKRYVDEEWLLSMRGRLKPSTWDSYRRNLSLHVLPSLGERAIDTISVRELNALYGELLERGKRNGPGGLSATTVRYIHVILRGAWRAPSTSA